MYFIRDKFRLIGLLSCVKLNCVFLIQLSIEKINTTVVSCHPFRHQAVWFSFLYPWYMLVFFVWSVCLTILWNELCDEILSWRNGGLVIVISSGYYVNFMLFNFYSVFHPIIYFYLQLNMHIWSDICCMLWCCLMIKTNKI